MGKSILKPRRNRETHAQWLLWISVALLVAIPSLWLIARDLSTAHRLRDEFERGMRNDAELFAEQLQYFAEQIIYEASAEPEEAPSNVLPTVPARKSSLVDSPFSIAFTDAQTELDAAAPSLQALLQTIEAEAHVSGRPEPGTSMRGYIDGPDGPLHFIYTIDKQGDRVELRGVRVNPEAVKSVVLPEAFRRLAEQIRTQRGEDPFGTGIVAMKVHTPDTTIVLSEIAPTLLAGYGDALDGMTSAFNMGGLFPSWSLQITCFNELRAYRWKSYMKGLIPILMLVLGVLFTSRMAMREYELSRAKSIFVSNVSHELKMPLAKIQFFNELLQRLPQEAIEKHQRYHSAIEQECERLALMVDNVLDFNLIERGQMSYEFVRVPIADVVREVVETFGVLYGARGYQISMELAPGLPSMLVDTAAIRQALINLMDNAVKYSEPHTLQIRVAQAMAAGAAAVEIAVQDRGIGIPEDKVGRIFEEFYRVDSGLAQRVSGSGLGLSLVRHIAEAHGGSVRVASQVGEGSTFTLVLPLEPQSARV